MVQPFQSWPADNRPNDGFVLVTVRAPGDRATVQIQPYRLDNTRDVPVSPQRELSTGEALFEASIEAAKGGLFLYVGLEAGATLDPGLGRLID